MSSFRTYSTPCAGSLALALLLVIAPARLPAQTLEEARELYRRGELRAALAAFRTIADEKADEPALAASARTNACLILGDLSEYEAALPECREALRLRRATDDPRRLARILNNLALVEEQLGRYEDARAHYREALAINRELGDAHAEVINLQNLAVLASQANRHPEALGLYARAAALAEAYPEEPWAREQATVARINQGVELERLGAYREALELYLEAREAGVAEPGREAALAVNLGVVYRNLGDPVRAVAVFEEAISVFESRGQNAAVANVLFNLGLARHLNLHLPDEAEADFRRALDLARAAGERAEQMRGHYYLGRLLLDLGRAAEASAELERCRQLAEELDSPEGRWSAYEGLGREAALRGDLEAALGLLLQALTEIERVRTSLHGASALRAGYFGERRSAYAATVRILAGLEAEEPGAGHGERALEIVQRAKARELLDSLGSRPGTAAPLGARALLDRVGDGVLVEYFSAEGRLYAWRLHRGRAGLENLGPAAEVFEAVRAVHAALAHARPPDPELLRQLSRILLRPVQTIPERLGKIYVAPEGALHYLPFEILADPLGEGEPLGRRLAVSYLPSASALAWLGQDPGPDRAGWIGFGAPDLTAYGSDPFSPAGFLLERFRLEPLPAAEGELRAIGERVPGPHVLRLGAEATESAFRRAAAGGARLTHLATHTLVDERPGRGAAILLAADREEDGLLYPDEIAGLTAPCRLTVLAACSTALGLADDGRAMASLTGSFLAAGSEAVLATLWEVDDGESAIFMRQLYYHLGRGLAPAEALHETKKRFLADPRWNRPDLWAAFVLIGETGPLVGRPWPLWPWLLAAGAALLLLRRKRRESVPEGAPAEPASTP